MLENMPYILHTNGSEEKKGGRDLEPHSSLCQGQRIHVYNEVHQLSCIIQYESQEKQSVGTAGHRSCIKVTECLILGS